MDDQEELCCSGKKKPVSQDSEQDMLESLKYLIMKKLFQHAQSATQSKEHRNTHSAVSTAPHNILLY